MLTQDEVITELDARGYEVTPRRLVDWRQKGLLPPLVKHGLGRPGGWIYVWEDPLVVEQAVAVQELLWLHGRTGWLYVPLWCLGFDVPLERVRAQMLNRVERQQTSLVRGETDPDAVAKRLSKLAFNEVTRPGPKPPRRGSAELFEYGLNLLAGDAEYEPGREGLAEITVALVRFMGWDSAETTRDGTWLTSAAGLRLIRRWTRRYAALPRLEEAARHATEAEWAEVHADWQTLGQLVRTVSALAEEEIPEAYRELGLRAVAIAGPWLSLVDLSMRRREQGQVWDTLRYELVSMQERLEQEPAMQEQMRQLWAEAQVSQDVDDEVSST